MHIRQDQSIFVSVASFADPECPKTVLELFTKAKRPNLVFIGVCQQNRDSDPDCKIDAMIDPQLKRQIRIIRLDHREARGPTHARYLCSTLWAGEQYFLQIDSHSLMAQDWDEKLIQMIKVLKENGISQKPIISGYPKEYEPGQPLDDPDDDKMVPTMCRAFFDPRDLISFDGSEALPPPPSGIPEVNAFLAGGLLFAESTFLIDVRFDPNLPQLFVGEEILHSARAWTSGYDIFAPTKSVVRHFYSRPKNYKYWDLPDRPNDEAAVEKVKVLLKLDPKAKIADHLKENLGMYGLGTVRTLEAYFKHAGIDPDKKIVTKNFCRRENGFKNKDNISYNATRKPVEKFAQVEGFMSEDGMFTITGDGWEEVPETWVTEDAGDPPIKGDPYATLPPLPLPGMNDMKYTKFAPFAQEGMYTDEMHQRHVKMLLGLMILGTILAWIWYANHSKF